MLAPEQFLFLFAVFAEVHVPPLPLEVDCRTTRSLLDQPDVLLLDCRQQNEHELANIAGAKLLPMSELADRISELVPYKNHHVIVHCHHGGRSLHVAAFLRQQGFDRAQSMAGGIDQWAVDIDPTLARY